MTENFIFGFFPNRAGVEQDDVGVLRRLRFDHAIGRRQHIGHARRVVLIHLAAKSFNKDFFWFRTRADGRIYGNFFCIQSVMTYLQ
jgi:hypothetical protein